MSAQNNHITLGIVIGTYNRLPMLRLCLESLLGKMGVSHEIVVTDAGSTDGTLEFLRHLAEQPESCLRLIEDGHKIGQARSLNQAVNTLSADYICWLSDDNVANPGMLEKALRILQKNASIGLVALKIKDITGSLTEVPYLGGMWKPLYILNCNQGILPAKLWKQLGGFDEEFRDYGIDGDLTTRVLLAGYRVVLTREVAVLHYRDHDTESWIDSEGRKNRMEEARTRYKIKFSSAIQAHANLAQNKYKSLSTTWLLKLENLYKKRTGKDIYVSLGYIERDVFNARTGNFISPWDLWRHKYKAYYLNQKIPSSLLKKMVGNS